ncbi:PIN domain-containing protein [Thauera aminoaromatica]|uniref:PIN domain-containing protein n=1 Tax=Thauera aminoaromatica TaxID=164330 RepID=UPI000166B48B|nr:PIN domain-containing protein [Thauera aminoaromatica]
MPSALRVVLDTKVLLSGLAYPGSLPGRIVAAWRHGSVDVVLSTFILDELRRVLPRLSARHGLSSREIDDLVDILSIQAELVEPEAVSDPTLTPPSHTPRHEARSARHPTSGRKQPCIYVGVALSRA